MNGRLVRQERLGRGQRAQMYDLFRRHFEAAPREPFFRDLRDKEWVIWLEDGAGHLVGFSTLSMYRVDHAGERLTVVYSGDTIVDPGAWRSTVLSRTWIDAVQRLYRERGAGRLLWLLIVSGFRTYRFLPVYFREFYPRFDRPTPTGVRGLMDRLASGRFGARYDPGSGIVRFATPQVLRTELSRIPPGKLSDPHVAFFARANPGHVGGAELVCLTELARCNLTRAARRIVRSLERRRPADKLVS